MKKVFRKLGLFGVLAAGALGMGLSGPAKAESPDGMKLYVFSSGQLTLAKSILQAGAEGKTTIPVLMAVIQHPKGNVLFDTGNNDKIITDPDYWGPFIAALDPGRDPDVAVDAQLKKIGLTTDDINYVAYSHMHADHGGNACKFMNSTHVFQRDEMRAAYWPAPGYATFYITTDFSCLRAGTGYPMASSAKTIELDGDLDLFGDGSVVVKRAVSHTPGSQMLIVRLPKTGTVLLVGDAIYLQENLDGNKLPGVGSVYAPSQMLDTYAYAKRLVDTEGASVMFSHDPDAFKALKHAPEFYE